ncbi:unnamed protein product [Sympodiomycopsis kandeliae]
MQAQVNPNEDTEFNDALRAHGIIPPKKPSRSPSPELPTEAETRSAALNNATLDEIDRALEADGLGPDHDAEENLLLRLREQRLEALAKERKLGRFGRVYPISRPDYTREVTEASKEDPEADAAADQEEEEEDSKFETGAGSGGKESTKKERKGTGVVCLLYKDAIEECRLLSGYIDRLAAKYPATKFVSIVGDQCIPNYPDKNLPTLLIYRNGNLHRQIIGLRPEIGLDGLNTKCEDIELLLTAIGVVDRSNIPGSRTHQDQISTDAGGTRDDQRDAREAEREEVEDEDEGFGGSNRKYDKPSVRSQEEEDAELDWDL